MMANVEGRVRCPHDMLGATACIMDDTWGQSVRVLPLGDWQGSLLRRATSDYGWEDATWNAKPFY